MKLINFSGKLNFQRHYINRYLASLRTWSCRARPFIRDEILNTVSSVLCVLPFVPDREAERRFSFDVD